MSLITFVLLTFPLAAELVYLKGLSMLFVVFYFIVKRKDDIALDEHKLFHLRTSLIPKFTKVDMYELSALTSIRCGGIHSDRWETIDILNGFGRNGGFSNTVEMSFRDGSSKNIDLTIDRDQLDKMVKLAYALRDKKSS